MAENLQPTPQQRVYNTRSRKRSLDTQEKEMSKSKTEEEKKEEPVEGAESKIPDCAICLQTCSHPARLPCSHIFCFLCLKGAAQSNRRCPMCRAHISPDYLENPELLEPPHVEPVVVEQGETYQWYYEGRHGWWEYDARSNADLEIAYNSSESTVELLLAGNLYTVDLRAMMQTRKSEPARRRRIKRDISGAPSKGIAGIRTSEQLPSPEEEEPEPPTRPFQRILPSVPTTFPTSGSLSLPWHTRTSNLPGVTITYSGLHIINSLGNLRRREFSFGRFSPEPEVYRDSTDDEEEDLGVFYGEEEEDDEEAERQRAVFEDGNDDDDLNELLSMMDDYSFNDSHNSIH